MARRRNGFGWTGKHHKESGRSTMFLAVEKVTQGNAEVERGNCKRGIRSAAEAARILGRVFQDFHAAGEDAFRDREFKETDQRLDALLSNIQDHCLKG